MTKKQPACKADYCKIPTTRASGYCVRHDPARSDFLKAEAELWIAETERERALVKFIDVARAELVDDFDKTENGRKLLQHLKRGMGAEFYISRWLDWVEQTAPDAIASFGATPQGKAAHDQFRAAKKAFETAKAAELEAGPPRARKIGKPFGGKRGYY